MNWHGIGGSEGVLWCGVGGVGAYTIFLFSPYSFLDVIWTMISSFSLSFPCLIIPFSLFDVIISLFDDGMDGRWQVGVLEGFFLSLVLSMLVDRLELNE